MISVATRTYFSALPIKFGPYAVRYSIHRPDPSGAAGSRSYLGEELVQRLPEGPVSTTSGCSPSPTR